LIKLNSSFLGLYLHEILLQPFSFIIGRRRSWSLGYAVLIQDKSVTMVTLDSHPW